MRSTTPPEEYSIALEVEEEPKLSLPSCRELFEVSDFGDAIRNSKLAFDFRTSTGSNFNLPPSPQITPPLSSCSKRFDFSNYSDGGAVENLSPQSTFSQTHHSSASRYASQLSTIRPVALSDPATSLHRSLLQPPFSAKGSSQYENFPYRKTSFKSRSFGNSARLRQSSDTLPKLPFISTSSTITPYRALTPPSPPLSIHQPSPVSRSPYTQDWNDSCSRSTPSNTVKRNQCPHCPKTFVRINDLKRHICIHSGER